MNLVAIVDNDSEALVQDWNSIATRDGFSVRFEAFQTPEPFFRNIERENLQLVLIHHHWPGLNITQMLQRIADKRSDIRVIVFTGQPLDLKELIECVRFGVADYWPNRGSLDPVTATRQIDFYCSNPAWTLAKLKSASGPQLKLLQESEAGAARANVLATENRELRAQLASARSTENKALWAALTVAGKFAACALVIIVSFLVVFPRAGVVAATIVTIVLAAFFLFLEGKISDSRFKWGKWSGSVASKTK